MLLGDSLVMREVRAQIDTLAPLPWHVRVEGPTGSGKRIAARLLHDRSLRANGPFIPCYLNMLPDETALDELVGHVRGAFTSAVSDRRGAAESAAGGTLCFDELGTASTVVQRALLQLVDQRVVQRLGECRLREVDVRIVFLTNVDLAAAVHAGHFREDLYWRLGQLVLTMPALSAHRDDIPALVRHIVTRKSTEAGKPVCELPAHEMDKLVCYDWPGNVRELERVLEHFVAFGHLPETLASTVRRDWRSQLHQTIGRHGGNKSAAARELGVSRKTLYQALRGAGSGAGVTGDRDGTTG
jgi:DNA-binding NtrC family response regulator